jgi:hypothetical protein
MGHVLNGFGTVGVFNDHKRNPVNGAARLTEFVRNYATLGQPLILPLKGVQL